MFLQELFLWKPKESERLVYIFTILHEWNVSVSNYSDLIVIGVLFLPFGFPALHCYVNTKTLTWSNCYPIYYQIHSHTTTVLFTIQIVHRVKSVISQHKNTLTILYMANTLDSPQGTCIITIHRQKI